MQGSGRMMWGIEQGTPPELEIYDLIISKH
jgi:hypothetical protein